MHVSRHSSRRWSRTLLAAALLGIAVPITAAAIAQSPASAAPAPAGLDHFLCYHATALPGVPPLKAPPGVKLVDQFSPLNRKGVPIPFTARFGVVTSHCNPALKVVDLPAGPAQYPPLSPDWHLLCLHITTNQTTAVHIVQVSNQFGTANLDTKAPNQFCLPSLKSLTTPPVFKPPAGEKRPDHFTCYPVTYDPNTPSRFVPPGPVLAGDQFNGFQPVPVQVLIPARLCLPTQKTINGVVTPITNLAAHLLCFNIKSPEPPYTGTVWDENQFGMAAMTVGPVNQLCLPSFKKIIK